MIRLFVIFVCLSAIIIEFFSIPWGWIILFVPSAFLLIVLIAVKQKKWKFIPELSDMANLELQKYGHYYAMPFAGRDFNDSAYIVLFTGAILAIISAIKGFWWGIGIGIANWILMGLVANEYAPIEENREIIAWILKKRGQIEKPD
jgi:hypothetical protein